MTLLMLLLTLAVVAGVIAVATGVIRGGLDEPAPTVPARVLPADGITGRDIASLRFVQGLRGYRMDQVDAALDALAVEVDRLRAQVAQERSARLQLARGRAIAPAGAEAGDPSPSGSGPGPGDGPTAGSPGDTAWGPGPIETTDPASSSASGRDVSPTAAGPESGPITRPLRRPRRRADSDAPGSDGASGSSSSRPEEGG